MLPKIQSVKKHIFGSPLQLLKPHQYLCHNTSSIRSLKKIKYFLQTKYDNQIQSDKQQSYENQGNNGGIIKSTKQQSFKPYSDNKNFQFQSFHMNNLRKDYSIMYHQEKNQNFSKDQISKQKFLTSQHKPLKMSLRNKSYFEKKKEKKSKYRLSVIHLKKQEISNSFNYKNKSSNNIFNSINKSTTLHQGYQQSQKKKFKYYHTQNKQSQSFHYHDKLEMQRNKDKYSLLRQIVNYSKSSNKKQKIKIQKVFLTSQMKDFKQIKGKIK